MLHNRDVNKFVDAFGYVETATLALSLYRLDIEVTFDKIPESGNWMISAPFQANRQIIELIYRSGHDLLNQRMCQNEVVELTVRRRSN